MLVELTHAGLDLLEIVGESLDLGGHGVEAGAGVGLNVLDRLLEGTHGGVELADAVAGLLDEGLHDGMILGHLSGQILLALQQRSHVALEFNEFSGDGLCGSRTDEAAADGAC